VKLNAIRITLLAGLFQLLIAAALWFVNPHVLIIPFLLVPIFLLLWLVRRYELGLKAALEKSRFESFEANRELVNVRQSVNKDPLTGLNSRIYVKERLDELLDVAIKRKQSCAILYLDLDFFKEFNEALGHTLGNQLLIRVANRLKSIVKKGDILGYYGGDEFIVILPSINDSMSAELVARRIITEMANQYQLKGRSLSVSSSIGIAVGPADGDDSETLIRRAESALKVSKANGRKSYSFYSQRLNESASEKLKVDQQLRGALERNEFSIAYQAIVANQGKNLKGFEALIRWNNPELGRVSPAEFIPIAEQIGLISEIGTWVLREATQQLKSWQTKYERPLVMSINVSPRQFQDESILPAVKAIINQTGVKPSAIQLEVTEGLFLSASDRTLNNIDLLKRSGIRLALDDFGTGFSSLSYLNRLPFDVLKIDKSFVDGLVHNERDRKMVKAIISLAHGLSMEIVVEGVETPQQVHELREMNADSLQGYYYSQPLSAKEAESRFLSRSDIMEMNENIWDKL
jgi:diguanylate cyclase (GGDEF)-like protein